MPQDPNIRIETVLNLLEDATSLDVVREFLRKKQLAHTAGSWKDMREKRLRPYLADFQITLEDLIALVISAEECGDQHIFLFQCQADEVEAMFDGPRTHATLRGAGVEGLIDGPDIERKPATPTLVEVRWDGGALPQSLTIKEAEVHKKHVLKKERPRGNVIVKFFVEQESRAINIAKLHRDGLLEIRIQSRDNTTKYDGDVNRFLRQVNPYFPIQKFRELSLTPAKSAMWARRAELGDLLRYTNASVVDEAGHKLQAATGAAGGNLSGSSAAQSVDFVLRNDENAYCSDSNLWFLKSDHLTSSIHVLLNGASNEFAVPRKCSAEDYGYVLRQIRHFNR
jgi:hypothetical protein